MTRFSTPRGTEDILPKDWPYWDFVQGHAEQVARDFGYQRIETPTFGDAGLFARATGEATDIAEKEMYRFTDRGGDEMALRPEGTAPVMRAYLQHGMSRLPQPVKLYYIERVYRAESPQRGRLREHHQFGCEAIGVEDPYVDVELMSLLDTLCRRLSLKDVSLQINSIGDVTCRPGYISTLETYLREHEDQLAPVDRDRVSRNPLRVLDSKEPRSQPVVAGAPNILERLCPACREHWDTVKRGLELLGIGYTVNPRLVRGLDYYTRTVFEFLPPREGAQAVIGAGGRYDALSQAMGGPQIPGVGFGSGVERLILTLKDQGAELVPQPAADVYIARIGGGTEEVGLKLATELRRAGVRTLLAFGSRSLKAQLRHADSAGARSAVIVGEDELREKRVILRDMRSGEQETVAVGDLVSRLAESD